MRNRLGWGRARDVCRVDTNLVLGMAAGADQWPVQRNQQAEGGKQGFEGGHSVVPLRLTQTKSASSVNAPLFILPNGRALVPISGAPGPATDLIC
ncbi:hypothetical protein D3C73_1314410 [compost metagenome]